MPRQPAQPPTQSSANAPAAAAAEPTDKPEGTVTTLSVTPVESIPEEGMTKAAAEAITPSIDKGPAPSMVAATATAPEAPKPKRYRVVADRAISSSGSRTMLRAGKELDTLGYNVRDLRNQGVKLQRIDDQGNDIEDTP